MDSPARNCSGDAEFARSADGQSAGPSSALSDTSTIDVQVPDDVELLEEMMRGLASAPEAYQPTDYWAFYEKRFLPELKRLGLRDFRRRERSVLDSFGAVDLPIQAELTVAGGWPTRSLAALAASIFRRYNAMAAEIVGLNTRAVTPFFYRYVREKFAACGLDLRTCPTTRFGNPRDLCGLDGGLWSTIHLIYCSMWADAVRYIRLGATPVIAELGAGLGRMFEIWGHLFPKATLLLFDIPPQLYVSHQYLTRVFGKRVVSYGDALQLEVPTTAGIPPAALGKIIILPTWQLPQWCHAKIDVFLNSPSFAEMEPDVVSNYLGLVKQMHPDWIYINALSEGKPRGQLGTKEPVPATLYSACLTPGYRLAHVYPTDYFVVQPEEYQSYLFRAAATDLDLPMRLIPSLRNESVRGNKTT